MKKIIFITIAILIMTFGSMSYLSYINTGKFNLPFANIFSGQSLETMVDSVQDKAASATVPKQSEFYKWQDANGRKQHTAIHAPFIEQRDPRFGFVARGGTAVHVPQIAGQ